VSVWLCSFRRKQLKALGAVMMTLATVRCFRGEKTLERSSKDNGAVLQRAYVIQLSLGSLDSSSSHLLLWSGQRTDCSKWRTLSLLLLTVQGYPGRPNKCHYSSPSQRLRLEL